MITSERDPLWKREVRERWRRPWTFLLLGVYSAFLAILARVFYGAIVPQGEYVFSRPSLGLGAPLFWRFVSWQILGWFPLGLLLGAPSLSLERERRSLAEYALAGITNRQVVRAKWLSLASFALVLVVAPLPVAALCFPLGGVSPFDFVAANTLCVGIALATSTMGLAISAIHRTVSAAYFDVIRRIVVMGIFIGPGLVVLPYLPPHLLLVVGAAFLLVPLELLPKIQLEIYYVMQHPEMDAPQTPDYSLSSETTSSSGWLDSEPRVEDKIWIPANSQELERTINVRQVQREQSDPLPSPLDMALESLVARNPLSRRDVRTQLRSWQRNSPSNQATTLHSLGISLFVGLMVWFIGVLEAKTSLPTILYGLWHLALLPVLLQTVLLSASGFARERAGNMMVQLHLSALSPSEILSAKFLGPFVMGARFWGFHLMALTIMALSRDCTRVVLEVLLFAMLLGFASLLGTLFSLLFRAVVLSTTATLFVLVALFVVLPAVFSPLLFTPPAFLLFWWLEPIHALFWGAEQPMGLMLPLVLSLGVLLGVVWLLCLRAWAKSVSELKALRALRQTAPSKPSPNSSA